MIYSKSTISLITLFLFLLSIPISTISANGTWDGGGDGIHWDDANNWGDDIEPIAGDDVIIPASTSVTIRMVGELASSITLSSDAILIIDAGSDITLDNSTGKGINMLSNSTLTNSGTINISNTSNEGIDMALDAALTNNLGAIINITNTPSEGFYLDDAGTIDNFGVININETDQEGLELDLGGTFHNHASGVVNISNVHAFECIENDATFINDGVITLTGASDTDEGINNGAGDDFTNIGTITITGVEDEGIQNEGNFINSGRIDVGTATVGEDAILNTGGSFTNGDCGIVNITSDNQINNSVTFTTNGVLTTIFTGTNTNSGVFTNEGEIFTSTGTLTLAPNAIAGAGTVSVGAIPASSTGGLCTIVNTVPTLSEWGIIIFILLLLSLGVIGVIRRESALATNQGNMNLGRDNNSIPFIAHLYQKALVIITVTLIGSFTVAILGFGYELTTADVPGSLLTIPIAAYLLHFLLNDTE